MTRIQVGEQMPDFTFNTADESGKQLHEYYDGKKLLVWVLRYIGCPTCRYDVNEFIKRYDEFAAKNANVLVVMQGDAEHLHKALGDTKALPFDIVTDTEMAIYKALDIKAAEDMEGLRGGVEPEKLMEVFAKVKAAGIEHGDFEGDELQLPAALIVDETGKVTYAHYAEGIADMPSFDDVLALL